jgi:hypothetical protein
MRTASLLFLSQEQWLCPPELLMTTFSRFIPLLLSAQSSTAPPAIQVLHSSVKLTFVKGIQSSTPKASSKENSDIPGKFRR